MPCSRSRRRTGPAGGVTIMTATASGLTAGRTRAGARAGLAASHRRAGALRACRRTRHRPHGSRHGRVRGHRRTCFPSRCGTSPTGPRPTCTWDVPDGRGHAADVGARGVYQAFAVRDGQEGVFLRTVGCRAVSWPRGKRGTIEVWKPARQPRQIKAGVTLRIQPAACSAFDGPRTYWATTEDVVSRATRVAVHFVDIPVPPDQKPPDPIHLLPLR